MSEQLDWFMQYDGPKFLHWDEAEHKFLCGLCWNETLVDFGVTGRDVAEYGNNPEDAIAGARYKAGQARGTPL